MKLLLVDGNCLLWCSAFAGKSLPLIDDSGYIQTVAFHHFVETLDDLEHRLKGRAIVVLDGGSDFRKAIDPRYKGNRSNESEARMLVMKTYRLVVAALEAIDGLHILVNGVEADDVISILAARCRATATPATIVADDRDFYQCLGATVTQYHPKSERHVTRDEALEAFGGCVKTFLIAKALQGDTGDNVKGFKQIGEKKSLELALFCGGDWRRLFSADLAAVYGRKNAYASLFQPGAFDLFVESLRLVRTATEVSDLAPWPMDPPSGGSLVPGAVGSSIERALFQLKEPRKIDPGRWASFLTRFDAHYLGARIERLFAIDNRPQLFADDVHIAVCDPTGKPA